MLKLNIKFSLKHKVLNNKLNVGEVFNYSIVYFEITTAGSETVSVTY